MEGPDAGRVPDGAPVWQAHAPLHPSWLHPSLLEYVPSEQTPDTTGAVVANGSVVLMVRLRKCMSSELQCVPEQ
eukprot:11147322-Alexandrium_andersonii.AAC.1